MQWEIGEVEKKKKDKRQKKKIKDKKLVSALQTESIHSSKKSGQGAVRYIKSDKSRGIDHMNLQLSIQDLTPFFDPERNKGLA